ncbi:hypothetical protein M3Y97_00872300 [Aphelenchoides bicaudatus]|nr:hypothetical protein M3Y97_00872300 [Aphelenchoides bicaudatus]
MGNQLALFLLSLLCVCTLVRCAVVKRQTYYYPDELRKYARPHAGTKFYQGTVARYAPSEWPAWYTRTLLRWNGESRLSPYHPSDLKYLQYQQQRIQSEQNFAAT